MLTRPEAMAAQPRSGTSDASRAVERTPADRHAAPTLAGGSWVLGAAATCLGSFLPWATVSGPGGTVAMPGTSTDGMLTLVLGAVAAVLAARHVALAPSPSRPLVALGVAGLVLVVATADVVELRRFAVEEAPALGVVARAGVGLWLTTLGAGVTAFGAGLCLREARMPRAD